MQKFHPLTEKIWNRPGNDVSPQALDSIIRTELEKMASDIVVLPSKGCFQWSEICSILGLLTESKSEQIAPGNLGPGFEATAKLTKLKTAEVWSFVNKDKRWCSCVILGADLDNWKYCPNCGAPKPTEKTLAEKFKAHGCLFVECSEDSRVYQLKMKSAEELAHIAEEHYGGKK
jgi:hypothetical protein